LKLIVIEKILSHTFAYANEAADACFFVKTYNTVWCYRQSNSGTHPDTITTLITNSNIESALITGSYAYRTLFPVLAFKESFRASKLTRPAPRTFLGISSQFLHIYAPPYNK